MDKFFEYFRLYSGLRIPELKPLETISVGTNLTEIFKRTAITEPKEE